jgi:SpoVK/Ycf46/Vps4 family AAA+-type ATPase
MDVAMAKKEISLEVSEKTIKDMATPKFKQDFQNLIRCRYPIFYVTTNEEKRFLEFVSNFSRVNGRACFRWNSYEGLKDHVSGETVGGISQDLRGDCKAVLDHIIEQARSFQTSKTAVANVNRKGIKGILYVLCDFFRFITHDPDIERRLRVIADLSTIVSVVLTGPSYKSTEVLENLIPVIDFPYANAKEIRHALYDVVNCAEKHLPNIFAETEEREEELINSVSGLTIPEAQTAFSKSIVSCKGWHIPTILEEKKQIISKTGLLEYFERTVPLEDVGGLKNLIKWIRRRKRAFTKDAEEYGLRKPRGLLLIGLPGCVCEGTKIRVRKIKAEGKYKIHHE